MSAIIGRRVLYPEFSVRVYKVEDESPERVLLKGPGWVMKSDTTLVPVGLESKVRINKAVFVNMVIEWEYLNADEWMETVKYKKKVG